MTCAGETYILPDMFQRRALHHLLIIALLACPLQCHADAAACVRVEADAAHGSDEFRTVAPATSDHTCPAKHSDRPSRGCPTDGESCQCICAGALIERPASESLAQPNVGPGLVSVAVGAVISQLPNSPEAWLAIPLHGAANHGRAVCLWHRLWRC